MGRIQTHNKEIIHQAEYRACEMKTFPSKLEERMQLLLDRYDIYYEPQKIFYIYANDGWIIKYYIADFFIPKNNLIIEVDGKFHDSQKGYDKRRTRYIQDCYPGIEVIRFRWEDLDDEKKILQLLERIHR